MPAMEPVGANTATLTATGGSDGYVNVGDNNGFYPGAVAYLSKSDGSVQQYVFLTDLNGTNKVGIRFIPESIDDPKLQNPSSGVKYGNLGRSDCSAFNAGSYLSMPAQAVPVYQPMFGARNPANS